MKSNIGIIVVGCLVWLLSSCLGSKDYNYEYEVYKNCQIKSFELKSDSVKELSSVKFTIDQVNSLIFNADSLPYGTEIDKVICTIAYMSDYSVATNKVNQMVYGGDSILTWNGTDTLDFSMPVKFEVGAFDEVTSKTYEAWINIHTVVPDSMEWYLHASNITGLPIREQKVIARDFNGVESYLMYARLFGGKSYNLFQSPVEDAVNWTEVTLSGLPESGIVVPQITEYNDVLYVPSTEGVLYQSEDGAEWTVVEGTPTVKYLLGAVKEDKATPSAMAAVVEEDGVLIFASMNAEKGWKTGVTVPALFPLTGFGSVNYNNMYREYLMLAGGRDKDNVILGTVWASGDGVAWAVLTDEEGENFGQKDGVMLSQYDDKFFLVGGITADGKGSDEIYTSRDNGITWAASDTLVVLPEEMKGRGFSSVLVDKDQYMLIFAGKTRSVLYEQDEVWRGRINRLGFEK